MKKLASLFIFVFIFTAIGCGSRNVSTNYHSPDGSYSSNIIDAAYKIADSFNHLDKDSTLIVTSFANINNLEESSPFGRMISEYVASRLSQNGFKIKEIKLRKKSIFMDKGQGEFILSRDMIEVGNNHDVTYFIVGTYTKSSGTVYVSARTINPRDSLIVSSCDVYIPLDYKNNKFYVE